MNLDRRAALLGATFTSAALADAGLAQVLPVSPPSPVTSVLCNYIVQAKARDLPEPVKREVCRTVLNYTGVAVGGSRHETVERAVAALAPFAGKPQANLLGRREHFDILHAALINGISSHIF